MRRTAPPLAVAMTLGCLVGSVALLAQSTAATSDLAKSYAEGGIVALLLKIGAVLLSAAAGAIYVLYRRVIADADEAVKLVAQQQTVLLQRLEENTKVIAANTAQRNDLVLEVRAALAELR